MTDERPRSRPGIVLPDPIPDEEKEPITDADLDSDDAEPADPLASLEDE